MNRDGNSVTESYWDTESTGQNNGIGVNRGTFDAEGLTTGEMQGSEAENNMNDLDFTDTWDVVADPDDYPILPTIEVTEGGVTVAVEPTTTQVGLDGEATVDVVVSGADAGVGAYDITGSVGDPAVASFTAIEETRTGGSGSTSIGSDGATATADRALLDEAFVSAATVTIATLTLSGEETGTTGITIDTATVGDDGGTEYTVSETQSATVEVTEGIDVTGDGTPATDTDGDGKLEDVNGDGESDVLDVQAFFENLDAEAAQNNPAAFDFNDDGDVSILDVQALFNQL